MTPLLVLSGITLLVLPGLRILPVGDVPPAEWARLAAGSVRAGLLALQTGLVLGAAPTVLRSIGFEDVADVCHRIAGPVMPAGSSAGWASAAAAVAFTWRSRVARRRVAAAHAAAHVEAWLGRHRRDDDVDVVVLPAEVPAAYAVPGPPPQVVLTTGLCDALSEDEVAAVVRHERSHLRHRHDHHLTVASVADDAVGWLPGVRRSTAAVRLAVERWADEDAAAGSGRSVVREALLKATAMSLGPTPAFSAVGTVTARLSALERPAPTGATLARAAVATPIASLVLTVALVAVGWIAFTHHGVFGAIGYCPV